MNKPLRRAHVGPAEWLMIVGAALFVLALLVSAVLDPSIRWLHFLQTWIYVVSLVLAIRGNRWGYFIGISAAAFWDYLTIFVNNFLPSGIKHVQIWIQTGHLARPDQAIAVPAWIGN